MKKVSCFLLAVLLFCNALVFAHDKISIIGGGIIGALESYYAYKDAQNSGKKIHIVIYEKGKGFSGTNTSYHIVPSLTIDEILSVVPRGSELIKKLGTLFSEPGGIRVDDVEGVNDSSCANNFKDAVTLYGSDINHDDRTLALLSLGKMSMDLWQQMYDEGDAELKEILEASNFNPCREPKNNSEKALHDGYRIDLIYGIENAEARALNMKADYEKLGYKNCALLSPDEVKALDPYLADFCEKHTEPNGKWKRDSAALWRPGGCVDTSSLLPKLYAYLKKAMGQDAFELQFGKEVCGIELDPADFRVVGLKFADGTLHMDKESYYIFCPGESVGTLQNLGFSEPTYAGFAGASLLLTIPLSPEQIALYKNFSHCMEVHNEGIVLAWQARFKEDNIFIGVAGTKAFYGDVQPNKNEAFAKNRNLLQLNMVNDVLPEFISLACGYDTKGKTIDAEELSILEAKNSAQRWVGRRAVAYDGFPTLGALYHNNHQVTNARCTTHLGSGGVSFGPAAVSLSRASEQNTDDAFVQKILNYADSRRAVYTR